jgi:hypothetical protein
MIAELNRCQNQVRQLEKIFDQQDVPDGETRASDPMQLYFTSGKMNASWLWPGDCVNITQRSPDIAAKATLCSCFSNTALRSAVRTGLLR